MSPIRWLLFFLPLLLTLSPGRVLAEALGAVRVTGDPVAPSPTSPGTGLCLSSRISTSPASDFPQSDPSFSGGLNTFLETAPTASNPNPLVTTVLRTPFDLSNNNNAGSKLSYGDFENAVPECPAGGCNFLVTDASVSFGLRLRGYLNVSPAWVGLPVHFGFYADDAVAFTLYDRQSKVYRVINRPPQLGVATWRTTNSITFSQPGLYPVEVLYAEITEHSALELSTLPGTFTDFERPTSQAPIVKLSGVGFELAAPAMFYQTETGQPAFPDLDTCAQCSRQEANTPGRGGCAPGYHCNGAALCAPCDTASFCGSTCTACGGKTPLCVSGTDGRVCAECERGADCTPPDACHIGVCDAAGTCSFPAATEGTVCPGGTCQTGQCVLPDAGHGSDDAGSSSGDAGHGPDDAGHIDGGDPLTDAGTPDGATPGRDGGPMKGDPNADVQSDGGVSEVPPPTGCGCGTSVPPLVPLLMLGVALLMKRGRRPTG